MSERPDPDPGSALSPALRALLAEARSEPPPGDATVARIRRATEASLPVPSPAPPVPPSPRHWAARAAWLLTGVALGAVGHAWLRPAPIPRAVVVVPSSPSPRPNAAPAPHPAPDPAPDASPPTPAAPSTIVPRAPSRGSEGRAGAERALIERCRSALARGDIDASLDAVREHARRYPTGVLVEEREALHIRALVGAGRVAEARARARQFMARWPNSLMRAIVAPALDPAP